MYPIRQRFTAWLGLALALLLGLAPLQGFVVCIEADGCVSVETKSPDASCGGCEGHDEGRRSSDWTASVSDDAGCPCLDVEIPGAPRDQRVERRSIELCWSGWVAAPLEGLTPQLARNACLVRGHPLAVPRVSESLELLRSVVLLV